ncbi:MAG: hypothetical protein JJ975_16250 [Bacteroidia bacterium]|nr:hypothetical protein [Bacteroidia bacterium]
MKNVILICVMVFGVADAGAQGVLQKLGDKAKEKTSNRVDNKVDQKMDEALDKIFERKKKRNSGSVAQDDTSGAQESGGSGYQKLQNGLLKKALGASTCNAKDQYQYKHNYLMEMVTTNKKGKITENMKFRIYSAETIDQLAYTIVESSTSPEASGSTIIMDGSDSSMIMLVNAEGIKSGFCSKSFYQNAQSVSADEQEKQMEDLSNGWTKTGNSKMIHGKKCYEHTSVSEGLEQTVWIANEGESMSSIMKAMAQNPNVSMPSGTNTPFGLVMEMTTKDTKSGETMVMKILEFNENQSKSISTNGYTFF